LLAIRHTGGVPGRHALDGTQELPWRAVAEAIVGTGFTGYFAHEFVPTRDPMTSLERRRKAVRRVMRAVCTRKRWPVSGYSPMPEF
jgi:hydroxypyruvate isomerase